MAILETHGLTMEFRGFRALDGVDLRVEEGEIHAVIGPNGAGKTTLFNLLSGLLRPSGGRVAFDGRDITGLPAHELARRGIARSFQITSVFPHLTVLANVELALQARTPLGYVWWRSDRVLRRFDDRAAEILAAIGLGGLAGREVATLPYGYGFVALDAVHWSTSGLVLTMVLLGGIGTRLGPLAGAALVLYLRDFLSTWTDAWGVVTGFIFIAVILVFRRGIVGTLEALVAGGRAPAAASPLDTERRAPAANTGPLA
jgi:ABC-type uncharacterized transport system YnjBCD ATPase subunit